MNDRTYDQTKPCPRCQQKAPTLRTKLEVCLFCGYPAPSSRRREMPQVLAE